MPADCVIVSTQEDPDTANPLGHEKLATLATVVLEQVVPLRV